MRLSRDTLWQSLSRRTRPVVAALLSRVWPDHDQTRAEARLAGLAPRDEAAISAAVLLILFLLAVLAAQFGWLGMAAYLGAILLFVR